MTDKPVVGSSNPIAAALRELIRLKDLKTDANNINTSGDWEATRRRRAMLEEHDAKKGEAWDAARRALHAFDSGSHETRALPESLRDPVKAIERGSMLLQLTEQRDIAWGALQAIKHGPPTWLNNDEVAGWAAREADKGFEPQAECEHGHNPRVCLECHPDEPPPVKASERRCICGEAMIPEGELRVEVGTTTHRLAGPCFQTPPENGNPQA